MRHPHPQAQGLGGFLWLKDALRFELSLQLACVESRLSSAAFFSEKAQLMLELGRGASEAFEVSRGERSASVVTLGSLVELRCCVGPLACIVAQHAG